MRHAILVLAAIWTAPVHAQQGGYSDAQIAQALTSTAWCSSSYSQAGGSERRQRAVFQPSGTLTVSTFSSRGSSGAYGSTYGESNDSDIYRWDVRNARLLLSNEEGVQDLTLGESSNSSGSFILLVEGQEWWPC